MSQKITDKIEIRTGLRDATLRGRRPNKESVPRPVPSLQGKTTTNDNDQRPLQSPTSPQTRPYPACLIQKPLPDPKKGSPVAVSAWCKPSRGRAGGDDEWKPETVEFPQPGTVQPVRPHTPPEKGACPQNRFRYDLSLPFPRVLGFCPHPVPPHPARNLKARPTPNTTRDEKGGRTRRRHEGDDRKQDSGDSDRRKTTIRYNTLQAVTISKHNNLGILCKFCCEIWVP